MDDNSALEQGDAVALWRSLRCFLELSVEVLNVPESTDAKTSVTVRFTVTNTSPKGLDWPEIVFENVNLNIPEVSGGGRSRDFGTLTSGQSQSYESNYSYQNLGAITANLDAAVSHHRFFRIREEASCPIVFIKPTIEEYLRKFNDIPIHSLLREAEDSIFIPGPETTLATLESHLTAFQDIVIRFDSTREILNKLHREFHGSGRMVTSHLKTAYEYMGQVQSAYKELGESVGPNRLELTTAAIEKLRKILEEGDQIDRATKLLIEHYGINP